MNRVRAEQSFHSYRTHYINYFHFKEQLLLVCSSNLFVKACLANWQRLQDIRFSHMIHRFTPVQQSNSFTVTETCCSLFQRLRCVQQHFCCKNVCNYTAALWLYLSVVHSQPAIKNQTLNSIRIISHFEMKEKLPVTKHVTLLMASTELQRCDVNTWARSTFWKSPWDIAEGSQKIY